MPIYTRSNCRKCYIMSKRKNPCALRFVDSGHFRLQRACSFKSFFGCIHLLLRPRVNSSLRTSQRINLQNLPNLVLGEIWKGKGWLAMSAYTFTNSREGRTQISSWYSEKSMVVMTVLLLFYTLAPSNAAESLAMILSYTLRIFSPQMVWNNPVPLLLPGKSACFNICCVISP